MENKMMLLQNRIVRQNAELIYAQVFHDTIKGSEWLPADFPLSPGRGALGYPALYVLYRILNEIHPKSILEMGMGQSTKVIGMYNHQYEECKHYVVEHDAEWIDFFSNHFSIPSTTEVIQLDIMDADIQLEEHNSNVTSYVNFKESLIGKKFDFIVIDGPFGYRSPDYARIDIISLLPECLSDNFIIMMDDTERKGENNTMSMIRVILEDAGIEHAYSRYQGEKDTSIIVSKNLSFLCTL